jgi:hypothetical protein
LETTKVSNLPAVPREQSKWGWRNALPLTKIPEQNRVLQLPLCWFNIIT